MSDTARRLVTLLVILGVVGAPAVALRALCVGAACDGEPARERAVPFCSLPAQVRELLVAGFREGRSPDALGVTRPDVLLGSDGRDATPWPSTADGDPRATVPLVLLGEGVTGGSLPRARLDDVAPTVEPLLGVRRPFPGVRSGTSLAGVLDPEARTSLLVTIVWKHVDADALPAFRRALRGVDAPAAFGEAEVGSLPLDPAAVLTTIGSGGMPNDHGITGSVIRSDRGAPVPAWSDGAPTSVIATLGDDLDDATGGGAAIGLVADARTDRGLIGGTWYLTSDGADDDDVVIARRSVADSVEALITDGGYGGGGAPDLLGVTIDGRARNAVGETRAIVSFVEATVPDATIVLTATGDAGSAAVLDAGGTDDGARRLEVSPAAFGSAVDAAVGAPVVAEVISGGVFVDQATVTERGISTQRVVDAMAGVRTAGGTRALADAFPGFAVTFGRYCA
ncbi:MAG TPA: hypothetical protein VLA82_00555 [Actinomycetota bacterium]|nr:hypothetical protein [Actinomycetota bacterium]